jgi:PAS domain S-box-containing protein
MFQEYTGFSQDELLHTDSLSLVHPEDRAMVRENAVKMLKGDHSSAYEFRAITKEGKTRWVMGTVTPIHYNGQRAVLGNYMDITERKCAEKALQESEQKYRILAENSMDGIFLAIGYRLVYANPAFLNIVGSLSMTAVSEINLMELISPEYRQQVQEDIWKALKGELTQRRYEVKATRIDGKGILLELSLSKVLYQGKPHALGIVKDITERKRAEESLKESEERYRALFENSTEGVFTADLAGNYTSVNKAMGELTGYSREELIGASYRDFVSPQTAEVIFREYNKLFSTGEPVHNIVYERISKDGKPGWLEGYANVIKKEGKVVGFQGTLRDITERRRVEQALRESEEKLRAQYKGIPVPTYTWQRIGEGLVLVDYNDAAVAITQGRIANFVGKKDSEMYQSRPDILEDLSRCFAERTSIYREMLYEYMSTGETKHLAVSYAFVPPDLVLVHTEDITESKRLEQSLKESEERYRTLFENSIEAAFTVDIAGSVTSGNKALEELTGCPLEEILGASYKKFVVPEDVDHVFKEYNKLFRTGKPIRNLVYEMVGRDGKRRLIEGYVNLISEGTRIVGLQGTLRDITERKKAAEQLERSFIDLAETVSRAMGSRDPYTAVHQRRVAELARLVGEKIGLDKHRLQGLYIGGLLHDIGKISAPETILTKSGKLTDEEWSLIRVHTKRGHEILQGTNLPWPVADMALHHHERLDGSGYPCRISGDELSLEVRILGVCDVVEAMSSHRPYRPARSSAEVWEELVSSRGTKYDASIVDVMFQIIESGELGALLSPPE